MSQRPTPRQSSGHGLALAFGAHRLMPRVCRGPIVCLAILLAWPTRAFGLDPSLDLSQYGHTAWKARDGLIKARILSITQTPDGYLWLGTDSGLLRFDGVRAMPWRAPNGGEILGKRVPTLLVTRDGTIWIGTPSGVGSWKDGQLTTYPELAGQHAVSMIQDSEGAVWIALDTPARVCKIQDGRVKCEGSDRLGVSNGSLYEDRQRNLWVLTQTGLWRWAPGSPYYYPVSAARYLSMTEDDDGTLLLGSSDGLQQLRDGKVESYDFPGVTGRFRARVFLRSRDGSLWVGTQEGLLHLHQGRTDRFTMADGLSGDYINELFEDREGNVWVGTSNGLDRFRETAVPTISVKQGLSTPLVFCVESTADGSVWGGTTDGLNRWQNGHMTVYARRSAPDPNERRDAQALRVGEPATNIADSGLSGTILSLGKDDSGRLWVASRDGVFRFEGDKFVHVPGLAGGIYSIEGDGQGNLWFLDGDRGLLFWKPDGSVQEIKWSQLGNHYFGFSMLPDRAQGGLWIGLTEGRVIYLKNNQVRAVYSVSDGLGSGRVAALRLAPDGALWAATEGGLSRIKDGHVTTLTSKNGLPCDSVHWSMEDDDYALWLYMPCGLVRVAREELDAWVSDPNHQVLTTTLDSADGVRSVGSFGGYGPHVAKSPDGKLWFLSWDGISVLDPHHLPSNNIPPPVHIEQITANGKERGVTPGLRLPPHLRDLAIDYSALSLSAPEKVRFRFKLEGQDDGWREVVNQRRAQYSNLAPGNYRFRVMASNNSGVWNEAGTLLAFSIAPAYYQTTWFRALCLATFVLLLAGLHRIRVHGLESKVKERTAELRKTNDDLQFVNGELDAFAYSVSHDLRAPLRHIGGFAELLQQQAEPELEEKSRGYIRRIRDSANRMSMMIEDLLAFSQVGRGDKQDQNVDLQSLVKSVVSEMAPDTQGRSIDWRIGPLPVCDGDPSMLRLVFTNLISNAAKFTRTRESAEIEIGSLNHNPNEVTVFVKDNGIGFDMDYKEKLFGVFQRLHSREDYEGTGVGLATVQRIVHRYGGRVWAEGAINQGATFYVALPKPERARS